MSAPRVSALPPWDFMLIKGLRGWKLGQGRPPLGPPVSRDPQSLAWSPPRCALPPCKAPFRLHTHTHIGGLRNVLSVFVFNFDHVSHSDTFTRFLIKKVQKG